MLRALILAGGKGTRIKEHTSRIPKPMIKANGIPLFVHIINQYEKYGVSEVCVLSGYKQDSFIEFCNKMYKLIDKKNNIFRFSDQVNLTILNTGENTMTGGRIIRALDNFNDDHFFLTYGDGVSNINIKDLYDFHLSQSLLATVTAVRPPARFGSLEISKNIVTKFEEKPQTSEGWINGGFFVINRKIIDFIDNDSTVFEKEPLEKISRSKNLAAFKHNGFWQCVDTIRDLERLEEALLDGVIDLKQ